MKIVEVLEERSFTRPRAPQTLRIYRRGVARLAACGLPLEVEAVTVEALRVAVERRLEEVQPQTAAVECLALYSVLSHLEETGRYDAATLRALRRLKPEAPRRELLTADWLTREEVEELAVAARETSSLVELTVRVAALTGLRVSELARLRWADVDLSARTVAVRWPSTGRIKTGRERLVPLVSDLLPVLDSTAARWCRERGRGLVLGCGSSLSAGVLARRMRRLAARSGLRGTLLLLRHSRASWWVQAGVPIAKVAKWLGNSPEIVARAYAGLSAGWDPSADLGALVGA